MIKRLLAVCLALQASLFGANIGPSGGYDPQLALTGGPLTVATLPTGQNTGTLAVISDGTSVNDCTVGGGSTLVVCQFGGSAWSPFLSSGGGSLGGADILITHSNGTSTPYFASNYSGGTSALKAGAALSAAVAAIVSGDSAVISCELFDLGSGQLVLTNGSRLTGISIVSNFCNPGTAIVTTTYTNIGSLVFDVGNTTNFFMRGWTLRDTTVGNYTLVIGTIDSVHGTKNIVNLVAEDMAFIGDSDNFYDHSHGSTITWVRSSFTSKWDTWQITDTTGTYTCLNCTFLSDGTATGYVSNPDSRLVNYSAEAGDNQGTGVVNLINTVSGSVAVAAASSGTAAVAWQNNGLTVNLSGGTYSIVNNGTGTLYLDKNNKVGGSTHYGNIHVSATTVYNYEPINGGLNDDGTSYYSSNIGRTQWPTGAVNTAASPYTVTPNDGLITCDDTSGTVTINLPAATGSGRVIVVRKIVSTPNQCTTAANGGDTIDGASSFNIGQQYGSAVLVDTTTGAWSNITTSQVGGDASGKTTNITVGKINGTVVPSSATVLGTNISGQPINNTNNVCVPGSFSSQTDGTTVTWAIGSKLCANAALLFTTHGGSRTLALTGLVTGGKYMIKLTQDGTGGEGLTLGSGCTWKVSGGGGGAITLTNAPNAVDILKWDYDGTNCYATLTANYS